MPRKKINKSDNSKTNARQLRKSMTKEEKKLWYDFLLYKKLLSYKAKNDLIARA